MWIESCNEFGDNFDPRPLRKEIMADISKCASWFRVFMGSSTSSDKRMNLWNALLEQDPEFVGEIFMALQVDKGSEFYFVDDPNFGWWGAKCFCVSGLAARIEGDHERIHELLKDPASPDWQLLVEIKQ